MNFISKIAIKIINKKNKPMKKQLELDEQTARRLYPTAAPEFKELLEQNFGKEFFSQKITDRIKDYNDILTIGNYNESKDVINIDNFDAEEHILVKDFIKKVRCAKVYRDGKDVPKRGDRRYYAYYDVSSGFVFYITSCVGTGASATSASRLCFLDDERTRDYVKKFKYIDESFIGVK